MASTARPCAKNRESGSRSWSRACGADRRDAAHELQGAAVRQIVPVDRGDRRRGRGPLWPRPRPDAPAPAGRPPAAARSRRCRRRRRGCRCRPGSSPSRASGVQHSPMFGQAASSQTVCSPFSRISRRVVVVAAEVGALTRIHAGLRLLPGWCGLEEGVRWPWVRSEWRGRTRQARPRASSRTGSGAGRWCGTGPPRSPPWSARSHSPGSSR